jgi:hypothetical protein
MERRRTSKFTFSLLLLVLALNAQAKTDDWYSISLGGDLSRFVLPFIDTTRLGWEVSGDVEFMKDVFAVVELGSETTNFNSDKYSYNSAGGYTRIGLDYNYMKHLDATSKDKLFVGFRYGFSTFYHDAKNITIADGIWGDATNLATEGKFLAANWLEVGTGMRARLINNFYLGWSVRFKMKLGAGTDAQLATYQIPGFGRGYGNSSVGVNYSLYYQIPFMKKSVLTKLFKHKKDTPETEVSPEKSSK